MRNPLIGVTERGDAALDLSWAEKLSGVAGAVIITKNVNAQLRKLLLKNSGKCILHATITGYGSTIIEPEVPAYQESLHNLSRLTAAGFLRDQIVVRVDPIIPTEKGIRLAEEVMNTAFEEGFTRFRISVLDMYPHVRKRFAEAGIPLPYGDSFQASAQQMAAVDEMLARFKDSHCCVRIECCAEPLLRNAIHCGCVSEYDLQLLDISYSEADDIGAQRKDCLCYSGKTELLTGRNRCEHQCLYCYWKDNN